MNSGPVLREGSRGEDVRRLQRIFVMMKMLEYTQIDGVFGPTTESRVRDFQQDRHLVVDGVVGPQTWAALPADPGTKQLARGDTGSVVTALQRGLRAYRGPGTPTDPGPADGDFGAHTQSGVRAYQGDVGVPVDGVVGDLTWWAPAGAAGATLASLAGLVTV